LVSWSATHVDSCSFCVVRATVLKNAASHSLRLGLISEYKRTDETKR